MIIRAIELSDFRNYETLALTLEAGTNILYGDNAQGKTNLLEAIYLSCTTKSHKGAKDREIIRFGQSEAHIRTDLDKEGLVLRVDMHLRAGRAKGVAIDGVRMKRASDFLQRLSARMILFSPEDLALIKGAPAQRRRFLDMELCQSDAAYMEALAAYQKTLKERAGILKQLQTQRGDETLLSVYDDALIKNARVLIKARRAFMEGLSDIIPRVHEQLTGGGEQLRVTYAPDCEEEALEETLQRTRKKDILTAQTNAGPHRDELLFLVQAAGEPEDLRKYGSQGQQRTAALTLKLSEIAYVTNTQRTSPVMLLDDVLSELDEKRQRQLLNAIGEVQTIITCTGLDEFVGGRLSIDKLFHVSQGHVTAEN